MCGLQLIGEPCGAIVETRRVVGSGNRVLEDAGVVRSVRAGRESLFALELHQLDDARTYLDQVSRQWDDALARLRAHVGG